MSLKESLNPTVSYRYKNTDPVRVQRLALFAGHYDTSEISKDASGNKMFITHGNPTALVDAGYNCTQVADDYNSNVINTSRGNADPIQITPVRGRTRVVDFMNYVKFSGLKVKKIRITDLSNDSTRALFNGQLEISQSSVGAKGGTDYLQLSTYIDPRNFQTNIIEIDLEEQNLLLDETTVVIMEIPEGANFQMDYILG